MGVSIPAVRKRRPSILFVSWLQFGYHTDSFEYCRYLRERFDLSYLSADQGLPRKQMSGVDVSYCGSRMLGKIEPRLAIDAVRLLRERPFDLAFLQRFKFGCAVRRCRPSVPMVFDVRSGSIEPGPVQRSVQNAIVRWNARCFRHITVISKGLARQLRLPRRAHVLPLGASCVEDFAQPHRDSLRLIYVGTFTNRALHRTVEGIGMHTRRESTPLHYSIVGFGSHDERAEIRDAIRRLGLESMVDLYDRVDHEEIPALLRAHNVGVAFTPRVPWYEYQPSTKVFEYLQNGLLCIATDNVANREVVSDRNGVLIEDSPEGFACGLRAAAKMLPTWQPESVAETVRRSTWERIVRGNLEPYLSEIIEAGRQNRRSE